MLFLSTPPGGYVGGADCHFPKDIGGCWLTPARIRGQLMFSFDFGLKRSWVEVDSPGAEVRASI